MSKKLHGSVLPHRHVKAVRKNERDGSAYLDTYKQGNLSDILETTYSSAAEMQQLYMPGRKEVPRFSRESLTLLSEQMGDKYVEPLLGVISVDIDTQPHAKWAGGLEEATDRLDEILEVLEDTPFENMGGYTTPRGLRLIAEAGDEVPASKVKAYREVLFARLRRLLEEADVLEGLELDNNTQTFNHLMMLPYATVNGRTRESEVVPPAAPLFLDCDLAALPAEDIYGLSTPAAGDMPEPRELSTKEWLEQVPFKWRNTLKSGEPVAKDGERHSRTITYVIPSLVGGVDKMKKLSPETPEILYQAIRKSIVAQQEVPTLEHVWDRLNQIYHRQVALFEEAPTTKTDGESGDNIDDLDMSLYQALVGDVEAPAKIEAQTPAPAPKPEVKQGQRLKPRFLYDGKVALLWNDDKKCYEGYAPNVASVMLGKMDGKLYASKNGTPYSLPKLMLYANGEYVLKTSHRYWRPDIGEEYFDPKEHILHTLSPPPKAPIKPVKHDDVLEWLATMCGKGTDQHNKLIDWLATMLELDKPTAAIFLTGPSRAGKSLFQRCVSSFWHFQSTQFEALVSKDRTQFQETLFASPAVFADEKTGFMDRGALENFKSLVTAQEIQVEEKYKNKVFIHSCLRFVLNGNDITSFAGGAMSNHSSNEAFSERVLHIKVREEARHLIKDRLPDRKHWTVRPDGSPGAFAETVEWLRLNHVRHTKPGRLLVSGIADADWTYRRNATNRGVGGQLLGVIVGWLENGRSYAGIEVGTDEKGNKAVIFKLNALLGIWKQITKDNTIPSSAAIIAAAKSMATTDADTGLLYLFKEDKVVEAQGGKRRRNRAYAIPWKQVLIAEEELGSSSNEYMEEIYEEFWEEQQAYLKAHNVEE